jgi:hypothetical protein
MKKIVVYVIGVMLCICLFCQSNIFVLAENNNAKSYFKLSMDTSDLQIEVDAGKYLKVINKNINFDVKVKNPGPNDCCYYKVELEIHEGLFSAGVYEELEPIYIFNDLENPLKDGETHNLSNIWSWTTSKEGLYRVRATVFDESTWLEYDTQYFFVRTPINRDAKYKNRCNNSYFVYIFGQFPILHRLIYLLT